MAPLLTKMWPNKEEWVTPSGGAHEEVDRFRRELGTDTLQVDENLQSIRRALSA